jgi:hypothetical protein
MIHKTLHKNEEQEATSNYNVYRIRSNHSNISKKGGANQNSQVCKTTLVKVDTCVHVHRSMDRSQEIPNL